MARFINPFTDVGFKKICGQEVSKGLLIDFLNDLLVGERSIKDITFLDKELLPEYMGDRGVIYDIYCTTEAGEHIIVEMQNRQQTNFKERALFYLSHTITRQGEKGARWEFDLKAVYGVFFMNFRLEDTPHKLRTDIVLSDRDTHEVFSDKLRFIFIELPSFNKEEEECEPDFLRDLDTAVMDELTGGGIKGNAAGLVGTLTQIKEIKQLCGLPFCGYMAKLETVRPSGVPDEVTVVFAEDVPYRACNGIEFDVMQEFVEGSRLLLTGKAQTLKDFQSGRLLVYILADFVAVSEKAVEQDEAAVRGVIANKPTYRETPRGKRITDITVKVRNELTGGSCFLPCICWQEQADEAAQWQQGDTVELLGRYQSRQYEKVLDTATGEREQRTAYEVSVRLIRRKEEAENER